MPTIGTPVFSGQRPKLAAHLLQDMDSSECRDVYIVDGNLRPLRGGDPVEVLDEPAESIFQIDEWPQWLQFDAPASIARSVNEAIDRIYVTAGSGPLVGEVGDFPPADGRPAGIFYGSAPYPNNLYILGVPVPGVQPNFVITNATPDPERDYDELDQETRYYAFTHVNMWDEESAVSPLSEPVVCYDDSVITVTTQITSVVGTVPIKSVRLYRTNTGTQATDFQFVKELLLGSGGGSVGETVFVDDIPNAYLSEVQETFLWLPPPVDLHSITLVGNSFFAGLSGREVCLSEVAVPYAWPAAYRFPIEDTPVTCTSNGVDLVVLTRGRPVVFTGNSPMAIQQIRISDYQPCLSAESVVVTGGMVVYASPDGLVGISSSQGFSNLTEEILTREQWQALNPNQMRCAVWESRILISSGANGYIFDLAGRSMTPMSATFHASFYDGYSDALFLLERTGKTDIYGFYTSNTLVFPYQWWSKEYQAPAFSFTCARVHADSYDNLQFKLEVDGQVVFERYVRNKEPFRLPAIRGRVIRYGLFGENVIRSASLATSPVELLP